GGRGRAARARRDGRAVVELDARPLLGHRALGRRRVEDRTRARLAAGGRLRGGTRPHGRLGPRRRGHARAVCRAGDPVSGALYADSTRACPLCGSRAEAHVLAARFDPSRLGALSFASRKPPELMHWRLVTCASCGLLYANPAPPADVLVRQYREAAFDAAG